MSARLKRVVLGLFLAASLPIWIAGCAMRADKSTISQVIYTASSGTILPELLWSEHFTITGDSVSLTRAGKVNDTTVNSGTWKFAADAQTVAVLFAQLGAVDCARLTRVEPDDPPDGGGAESFEIVYANGNKCALTYDAGVTYTDGERIVAPIRAFVRALALPAGAAPRYGISP